MELVCHIIVTEQSINHRHTVYDVFIIVIFLVTSVTVIVTITVDIIINIIIMVSIFITITIFIPITASIISIFFL